MSARVLTTAPSGSPSVAGVDKAVALARLPEVYAAALRLRDAGADERSIAHELGMEREAVEPLLRVAVAKLDALMAQEDARA